MPKWVILCCIRSWANKKLAAKIKIENHFRRLLHQLNSSYALRLKSRSGATEICPRLARVITAFTFFVVFPLTHFKPEKEVSFNVSMPPS